MGLSREVRAELDRLTLNEVLEETLEYVVSRHRLLNVGHSKLVAIADDGKIRKAYIELGMSPNMLELTAR